MNRRAISQLETLENKSSNDDEAGPSNRSNDDDNSDMMDVQTDATDAGGTYTEERLPSIGEEGDTLWSDTEPEVLQPYQE